MQLTLIARDAVTAARATWSVASSGRTPRWQEYMAWIDARRDGASRHNAHHGELGRRLVSLVRARGRSADDALPWDGMRPASSRRMYAALISFVDDYGGPFPTELFPRDLVRSVRVALRGGDGGVRTVEEQLAIAMDATDGCTFAAAVVLHAAMRQVARNRDRRALGALDWDERLRDASWIAPFAPEIEGPGDPPGDTYHYWANFAVGYHAARRGRLVPRALGAAFYAGPVAMTLIRGRVFGSGLVAGDHAQCDRMGLRHGAALARAAMAT